MRITNKIRRTTLTVFRCNNCSRNRFFLTISYVVNNKLLEKKNKSFFRIQLH